MTLSIISIAIVAGLGYLWLTRGFYSALLNFVCCLIAGAIAFGMWETVAYMLLDKGKPGDLIASSAWGIALAGPFAAAFVVLRLITDKFLRANVKVADVANYIGGGLCGAGAGVITAGIVVISLGMLRVDTEFMGFQAIDYGQGSSLKREHSLILPVDKLVARMYGQMSLASLSTDTPMAKYQPNLEDLPSMQRMSFGEGASRNTLKPDDCRVIARYTVGGENASLSSLLSDSFSSGTQQVEDLDGEPFPSDSRLEGVVIDFTSGAKEKGGQVVIGPAQVRLVSEKEDGTGSIATHPIAVVSRTEPASKVNYARFRFDARDLFVPSVGGDSSTKMGFEFVVPKGYKPLAVYVKSTRYDLPGGKAEVYASPAERDAAVKNGTLVKETVDAWDPTKPKDPNERRDDPKLNERDAEYWGVHLSKMLPEGACIQDGTQGADLTVKDRKIIDGRGRYETKLVKVLRDVPRELQCREFQVPERTSMVQVEVSLGRKLSLLGKAAQSVERILPPLLVSTDGQKFEAIGYYYEDDAKVVLRYTVGEPIRGLTELDRDGVSPTQSRSDQKLYLLFAPSTGVELKSFNLGSKVIQDFPTPIKTVN